MSTKPLSQSLRETRAVFDVAGVPLTTNEVAGEIDMSRRSTYARLNRLVEENELTTKKVGSSGRIWWRPQDQAEGKFAEESPETAEQLRALVDAVEEYAIFALSSDGEIRTWNPGAKRIKGYEWSEIVGEHFSTFYTEEDREAGVPEQNLRAAATDGYVKDEGWRVRGDGTQFWANVTITAIRDDVGQLEGFAKVTRDMTERRERERKLERLSTRLERELEDLEHELDEVLNRISHGFYSLDDDLRFGYINDHAKELLDLDESSVGAEIGDELVMAEAFENALHEARDTQQPIELEDYYNVVDEWFYNAIYPSETGLSVYFQQITERKERERSLERYATLLEAIGEPVYELDTEGHIVFVNDAVTELTGYEESEILGEHVSLCMGDEDISRVESRIKSQLHDPGENATIEFDIMPKTGEPIPVEQRFALLTDEDGRVTGSAGMVRDISDRKLREEELELFQTIVEAIDDGVYVLDEEYCFTYVNNAYASMTGYDRNHLLGKHCAMVVEDTVSAESAALLKEVTAGVRDSATLEADLQRADGTSLRAESKFTALPTESGEVQKVGLVRDVRERVEREQRIQSQYAMQEAVADIGRRGLESEDLDDLMAHASTLVADTLDNEYCKVLDLDDEGENLLLRQGVGWDESIVGLATIAANESDSQAAYTLATEEPIVVEHFQTESRFSGPDILTNHDVASGISVIIGSFEDPWGILGTHDTEAKEFTEIEVNFVQSVANVLATAIDRHRNEQTLRHRNESLVALNDLNTVSREITESVIAQSTREEIEQITCEALAATDAYEFAWLAASESGDDSFETRAYAETQGYHEDITVSIDPDDPRGQGPGGKAFHQREMQVVRDVFTDPSFEPWRDAATEYGFCSMASVPIVHGGIVYGVLGIYTDRSEAFDSEERAVVSHLGEIVGHAIAAAERKQAMMSDEIIELELQVPHLLQSLSAETNPRGTVTVNSTIPIGNGRFLLYGNTTSDGYQTLAQLVEKVPMFEDISKEGVGEQFDFRLQLSEPPVTSALVDMGGYVNELVIEDGDARGTIHLAPTANVRHLMDIIEDVYPDVAVLSRKQITRSEQDSPSIVQKLLANLTDRQRLVLNASYQSGYFEWPRRMSGEEVAESLDIAPATFSQHLRKAEKHLLDFVYDTDAAEA